MTIEVAPQPPLAPMQARRKPSRAPFWIGFVIGFTLLTVASCGGAVLGLGLGGVTLDDLRGDASSWTPPTLIPTSEAPSVSAPALVLGAFAAGQNVRNVTGSRVNVRSTPGHLGKPANDVLLQLAPGEQIIVLGDTAQVDNLTWWRVRAGGVEGWVAEATASGVQILGE